MLKGFKEFVLRGNVLDLAVGVIIGASFNNVVNSLVKNLMTPLIGAVVKTPDFSRLSFSLNGSTFNYGELINAVVSFLLVATAVYFFVVLPMNSLTSRIRRGEPASPSSKTCPECLSEVPVRAVRCAHCTQPLPAQ